MGKGFKKGAGGANPLNFKVVGGTAAPANPRENTIWVNTDTKITSWVFSAAEPEEPAEGMVWISTGASSRMEFNALKKNTLLVYPSSVKQYVGGTWVDISAQIYKNGEWADWYVYLYNLGNTCDSVTGGYKTVSLSSDYAEYSAVMDESYIYLSAATSGSGGTARNGKSTVNAIDLTNVNTIYASGNCSKARNNDAGKSGIGIRVQSTDSLSGNYTAAAASQYITETGDFEIAIDVSALSGEYYIVCFAQQTTNAGYSGKSAGEGTFSSIWMQ